MDLSKLVNPSAIEQLFATMNRYPFPTIVVASVVVIAVWMWRGKKSGGAELN